MRTGPMVIESLDVYRKMLNYARILGRIEGARGVRTGKAYLHEAEDDLTSVVSSLGFKSHLDAFNHFRSIFK